MSGTASLVLGIISDTMFINTVSESKIVTPENARMGGGEVEEMVRSDLCKG